MNQSERETRDNPSQNNSSGWDPKTLGIISYLTIVGWVIALFLNNPRTEYVSFHLRQSIGIILFGAATSALAVVPVLGWMVAMAGWGFTIYLWLIAFLGALQGEEKSVPFFGDIFQDLFKSL